MIKQLLKCGSLIELGNGQILLGWGKRTWMEEASKEVYFSFYAPDFFLENETPWFVHEHYLCLESDQLISMLQPIVLDEILDKINEEPKIFWKIQSKEEFRKTFNQLLLKFENGELTKAVPYAKFTAPFEMTSKRIAKSLLKALVYTKDALAYIYGMWGAIDDEADVLKTSLLGATPEVLFHLKKSTDEMPAQETYFLETMACAGTLDKMANVDDKLLQEHFIVVNGIAESLESFAKVAFEPMHLRSYGSLKHLVTKINAQLSNEVDLGEMIKALHPTAALGAYPKFQGNNWLKEYSQSDDRGHFGAPFGCYSKKNQEMICYVAIRNIEWCHSTVTIRAGCGIISLSQFENEWDEINLKFNAIKEILL